MNFNHSPNLWTQPQQIEYAKAKSDVVAMIDGTFKPRPKKEKKEVVSKKRSLDTSKGSGDALSAPSGPPPAKAPKLKVNDIPHRILFAQALPPDTTQGTLVNLFQPYPGTCV